MIGVHIRRCFRIVQTSRRLWNILSLSPSLPPSLLFLAQLYDSGLLMLFNWDPLHCLCKARPQKSQYSTCCFGRRLALQQSIDPVGETSNRRGVSRHWLKNEKNLWQVLYYVTNGEHRQRLNSFAYQTGCQKGTSKERLIELLETQRQDLSGALRARERKDLFKQNNNNNNKKLTRTSASCLKY